MPGLMYFLLFVVLLLYTYGVFGSRREVLLRYAAALLFGVALDSYTTSRMMVLSGRLTIHGVIGLAALGTMGLYTLLVLYAVANGWRRFPFFGPLRTAWKIGGPAAYGLWIFSLITGCVTHVAAVDRSINLIGG